jgi:hypothetical protein
MQTDQLFTDVSSTPGLRLRNDETSERTSDTNFTPELLSLHGDRLILSRSQHMIKP